MTERRGELERRVGLSDFGGLLFEVRDRAPGGVRRALAWYADASQVLDPSDPDADAVLADINWLFAQVPEFKVTRVVAGPTDAITAEAVEHHAASQAASRQYIGLLSEVDAELEAQWRRLLLQQLGDRGLSFDEASGLVGTARALARPRADARWLVLQQVGPGPEVLLSFGAYPTSWREDERDLVAQVSRAALLLHRRRPPESGGGSPARPPAPPPTRPRSRRSSTPEQGSAEQSG